MYYKNNILYLMKINNLNKNQLSFKLNITRQAIQHLIDSQNPTATTLIKLKEIFNVSIDDLLLKDLENEK